MQVLAKTRVDMRPLGVMPITPTGPRVLFACDFPDGFDGEVTAWATCGSRKRLPIRAEVASDVGTAPRMLRLVAFLPQSYAACTMHVVMRSGTKVEFASCRVNEAKFHGLPNLTPCASADPEYHAWLQQRRVTEQELFVQRAKSTEFALQPLVSVIVPIYRTPRQFLTQAIASVLVQSYAKLELVIVNVSGECEEVDSILAKVADDRVRVVTAENGTIPENTNVGIRHARGDYVAFADHDDFMEPDILYRYVAAINERPESDLLFCDEDLWSGNRFYCARFKPRWNPDFLLSNNYVCHMLMVSRWALDRVELSPADVNGAQDFDLTLKVAQVARAVTHVPGILYHWRVHPGSTASSCDSKPYAQEAGRRALADYVERAGLAASVSPGDAPFTYRLDFCRPRPGDMTMILVGKEAAPEDAAAVTPLARESGIPALACNWSGVNDALARVETPYAVLVDASLSLDDDRPVIGLTGQLVRHGAGCVSGLVVDGHGMVESCGLVLSESGAWKHCFAGWPQDSQGYMSLLNSARDVLAVPLALVALRTETAADLGGFDTGLPADWAMLDFCLRLHRAGLRTVLHPDYAIRDEHGTLPSYDDDRLAAEMAARHDQLADGDPYRNPYLPQNDGSFNLEA